MEFSINRDIFLKSLSHAYGIIEKKTTLPILSNILIEAKNKKIRLTLDYPEDLKFFQELYNNIDTTSSGKTIYSDLLANEF